MKGNHKRAKIDNGLVNKTREFDNSTNEIVEDEALRKLRIIPSSEEAIEIYEEETHLNKVEAFELGEMNKH